MWVLQKALARALSMRFNKRGMKTVSRASIETALLAAVLFACFGGPARALSIRSHYSRWNRSRPRRSGTEFIILHTTEGKAKGSLDKLRRNGEAHYFVDTNGKVYRIIHRDRVALHAGRSMWDGRTNLDNRSIGIEVVGYHNKSVTEGQIAALRDLLADLQRIYNIPDERVLTHSMVAYGAPNRWHSRSHRGRKRCGMLFARRSLRLRLGLERQPSFDPDVRAGRLTVGDPYLAAVLYGDAARQKEAERHFAGNGARVIVAGRSAWDIARDEYNSHDTVYIYPDGTRRRGDEIRDWRKVPAGTRVEIADACANEPESVRYLGRDGGTAAEIAGDEFGARTTIYFLPDGRVRRGDELSDGDFKSMPGKTGILVGYVHGGAISSRRSAFDVCGPKWNYPSTVYRFPDGGFRNGKEVDEGAIPGGTLVFFRN